MKRYLNLLFLLLALVTAAGCSEQSHEHAAGTTEYTCPMHPLVGQLVSARVTHITGKALWVPQEAVLDLGTQSVAFKKVDGVFEPVRITPGLTEGKQTQIVSGLQPQDVIAANAQFLVDSESFIKVNK